MSWSGKIREADKYSVGNESGFTLLEVLISTAILAMLIYVSVTAYSFFLNRWQKQSIKISPEIERFRMLVLLQRAIEGTYDYYTQKLNQKKMCLFFRTASNGFEFITLNSVFESDTPAVVKISFDRQDNGTYSLVYSERTLSNTYIKFISESIQYEKSLNILEHVRDFALEYYGVENLSALIKSGEETEFRGSRNIREVRKDWYKSYNGDRRYILPEKIKISIKMESGNAFEYIFFVRSWNVVKQSFFQYVH